jgi:hypothetical protein
VQTSSASSLLNLTAVMSSAEHGEPSRGHEFIPSPVDEWSTPRPLAHHRSVWKAELRGRHPAQR